MSKRKKQAAGQYRVFSVDPGVGVEERASNKSQAVELANTLAEQHPNVTFTVWNPNNEHIYQVNMKEDSWSVHAPHKDVLPEEMADQEHLMMSRITRPLGREGSAKVPRIIVNGAVYKQAQLQELLQQYETASGGDHQDPDQRTPGRTGQGLRQSQRDAEEA